MLPASFSRGGVRFSTHNFQSWGATYTEYEENIIHEENIMPIIGAHQYIFQIDFSSITSFRNQNVSETTAIESRGQISDLFTHCKIE